MNIPVSIYPKTALGTILAFQINKKIIFRTSIYDGDAGSLKEDPHNLDWSVQNLITLSELELATNTELNTFLKAGGYYHSGEFSDPGDSTVILSGNYGFYLVADQLLIKTKERGLGIFIQAGYTPKSRNFNTWYTGIGLNILTPFARRPNDILACGIACAGTHHNHFECDLECNYSLFIHRLVEVQPVLHYIIHPEADQGMDNAFAGFLRLNLRIN
jgi:carbohydrate-selective porin OprB